MIKERKVYWNGKIYPSVHELARQLHQKPQNVSPRIRAGVLRGKEAYYVDEKEAENDTEE